MQVNFYKCLDRPVDIFGLKGKWITVFLVMAGASLLIALFLGFTISSRIGIAAAFILVAISFFVCLTTQSKVSYRQIMKIPLRSLTVPYVFRRETLYRIMTIGSNHSRSDGSKIEIPRPPVSSKNTSEK